MNFFRYNNLNKNKIIKIQNNIMYDLNFFLENGYVILDNVFSEEYCDKLVNSAYQIKSNGDDLSPIMNPHKNLNIFLDAMSNNKILNFIKKYFDGEVMGLQTEFFFMPPKTLGFTSHQDNTYVQADEHSFVSAWVALTDVTTNNGGLIIWPKSHKEKKIKTVENKVIDSKNQDPNARSRSSIVPKKYEKYSPKIKKGSILMIDAWLVHASNNNNSNKNRNALLCTYIKKNANFRLGKTAKRKAFSLL